MIVAALKGTVGDVDVGLVNGSGGARRLLGHAGGGGAFLVTCAASA